MIFYVVLYKNIVIDILNASFAVCIKTRKNNKVHARILIPYYSLLERKPLYSTSGR